MPVDMREWLPEDHPVWWFVSLVESLDMSAFEKVNRLGGAGRAAYDPRVLTAVLLYGYWNAQLSSRRLERLCQHDVGFRVLARGLAPDHSTLARFRQAHAEGLASVFAQVLVVCAQVGMVQLDTVAIDGTKIAADVSETSMADAARLETLATRAREHAEQVIAAAEQVDAEEQTRFGDGVGDELPADLRQARARLAKIQALQQQLADREQVRAQAAEAMREQAAQYLKAVADPDQRIPHGHVPPMVDPVGLAEAKLARAQALAARKAAARTRGYRQGQDWQPAPVVARSARLSSLLCK